MQGCFRSSAQLTHSALAAAQQALQRAGGQALCKDECAAGLEHTVRLQRVCVGAEGAAHELVGDSWLAHRCVGAQNGCCCCCCIAHAMSRAFKPSPTKCPPSYPNRVCERRGGTWLALLAAHVFACMQPIQPHVPPVRSAAAGLPTGAAGSGAQSSLRSCQAGTTETSASRQRVGEVGGQAGLGGGEA